jgi:hypothetical protein
LITGMQIVTILGIINLAMSIPITLRFLNNHVS